MSMSNSHLNLLALFSLRQESNYRFWTSLDNNTAWTTTEKFYFKTYTHTKKKNRGSNAMHTVSNKLEM